MDTLMNQLFNIASGAGSGINFFTVYAGLGTAIFGVLMCKLLLTEGLSVASGNRTELPKLLIKWALVAAALIAWPMMAQNFWNGTIALAIAFFPDLDTTINIAMNSMTRMSDTAQAEGNVKSVLRLVTAPTAAIAQTILNGLMIIIGMLALFLCFVLILINIIGSLTVLLMNLVLAPVFIAFSVDRDFRPYAMSWFSATLSYALLMPLYGLALQLAVGVFGSSVVQNWTALPTMSQITAQLLGPFMSIGIVFSTNKVVAALVGGASGSGLGSSVLGGVIGGAAAMAGVSGGAARGIASAAGGTAQAMRSSQKGS